MRLWRLGSAFPTERELLAALSAASIPIRHGAEVGSRLEMLPHRA
jgi:hypothetical protein